MIYIENQDDYKDSPITIGVSNYNYANGNPNPLDVLGGLFEKGQQTYEKGAAALGAFKGDTISTNVGGYDVKVTPEKDLEKPKKILGLPKPIFIGGLVAVVVIGGYFGYSYMKKKGIIK
jgi:hypothetical protein